MSLIECPNCHESCQSDASACPHCKFPRDETKIPEWTSIADKVELPDDATSDKPGEKSEKFKTLKLYGTVFSGLGWIIAISAAVAVFIALVEGVIVVAASALPFVPLGISMVLGGQLISCFVSIEENTRRTFELLQQNKKTT
jgi:predicted phage tail protein